jgi:hypothetical protein
MKLYSTPNKLPLVALLSLGLACSPLVVSADNGDSRRQGHYQQDRGNSHYRTDQRREQPDYQHGRRYDNRHDYGKYKKPHPVKSPIIHHGHSYYIPQHRIRRYRDIVVVRPYGPLYGGYGAYYQDDDAYKWLAFTAIAVKLLDNLNEQQQREHEAAQVYATTAPLGETISWRDGNASGYVTATREGTSSSGRYCREFQHEVTIGGKREQSYGTACRQPDGSWEVVSTGQ